MQSPLLMDMLQSHHPSTFQAHTTAPLHVHHASLPISSAPTSAFVRHHRERSAPIPAAPKQSKASSERLHSPTPNITSHPTHSFNAHALSPTLHTSSSHIQQITASTTTSHATEAFLPSNPPPLLAMSSPSAAIVATDSLSSVPILGKGVTTEVTRARKEIFHHVRSHMHSMQPLVLTISGSCQFVFSTIPPPLSMLLPSCQPISQSSFALLSLYSLLALLYLYGGS